LSVINLSGARRAVARVVVTGEEGLQSPETEMGPMAEEPGESDPPEHDGATEPVDSDDHGPPDPTAERRTDATPAEKRADGPDHAPTDDDEPSGSAGDEADADGEDIADGAAGDAEATDADAGADDMWAGLRDDGGDVTGDADGADDGYDPSAPVDPDAMGIQTTDRPSADGGYADGADPEVYEEFDDSYGDYPVEGAPDDEEMPLADHIEEMIKRLGVVVVVIAIVSAITFPLADRLINFLWFSYLPGSLESCPESAARAGQIAENAAGTACPRVYNPLALILARLKVASLVGFVVALPVFVYESYLFMRPGLYPRERRYYLASVPTSLFLAAVGVLFAHLLVLPVLFTYFLYYSTDATTMIAFGLTQTFDLMVLMLGGFALIFQIPLFVMLALMMGIVTRAWLAERRILFWGAFAGLAFLFSPDPTGMAPIIVAATMIVLFEGTLLLARWTRRGDPKVDVDPEAGADPEARVDADADTDAEADADEPPRE
jgi:sec-independent protein translocase protein TatC